MTWRPLDDGLDAAGAVPRDPALDGPVIDLDLLADLTDLVATVEQPESLEADLAMSIAFLLVPAVELVRRLPPLDIQRSSRHRALPCSITGSIGGFPRNQSTDASQSIRANLISSEGAGIGIMGPPRERG